jgi:hypothetical protein
MAGDAPVCSPKQYYNCTADQMKMFFVDNGASSCNCARQCTKLTYKYTVTQSVDNVWQQVTVTQSEFSNVMISYVQNVKKQDITRDGWMQDYAGLEVRLSLTLFNNHSDFEGH